MAEVITSGKVIKKPEIVLDPTDFLPPGIIDVRTQSREEAGAPDGFAVDNTGNDADSIIVIENPDSGENYRDVLPVPQDMTIISQTVKVGRDKKITIDVLIETSDLTGVDAFEVRLSTFTPLA